MDYKMNNSIKTILTVLLVGTLGAGSLITVALANTNDRSNKTLMTQAVEDETEMEEDRESEAEEKLEEEQEAARLQPLAKISADRAREAALQVQDGEVTELELEAEDGSLVYEVTIGETEVFVDAGNGDILYTQGVNEKIDEATEQARPRGSIQVGSEDNVR